MATRFKTNTNPFTISHYILLFLVIILCTCIIGWVIIHRPHPHNPPTITHIQGYTPCVQRTTATIEKMWKFSPELVPQKYWSIAMQYLNQPITSRTYGICMDVAFTCRPGQILRDCDPCAVPSARAYAQSIHTADMISANCSNTTK